MEDNYPKAYKEVMEILNYVPQESVNKIPPIMIEAFRAKMDINYDFHVDTNKGFEEQELLEETKAILANIFRDCWATPYQKERIEAKEKNDRRKAEEEKRKQYNPEDLFKKKQEKKQELKNNLPMEVKKDNFYRKMIAFFKKNFHIL